MTTATTRLSCDTEKPPGASRLWLAPAARIGLANQTTMLMSESLAIGEELKAAMTDRWGAAGLAELVDDAVDEGGLRADDGEIDAVVGGELEIVGSGEDGGRLRDAGVARGGEDAVNRWALGEAPSEGVFAAVDVDRVAHVEVFVKCGASSSAKW